MKREDLVRFFRRRRRPQVLLVSFVFLLYLVGVGLSMNGTLERINPRWSADFVVPVLTAVVIALSVLVAMSITIAVPKCPHCGVRFTAWLLHIAIASGNCGYCGKSIED